MFYKTATFSKSQQIQCAKKYKAIKLEESRPLKTDGYTAIHPMNLSTNLRMQENIDGTLKEVVSFYLPL